MTIATRLLIAAALLAAPGVAVQAQQAETVRLRGTIENVSGNVLTLKAADGEAKLTLADNATIVAVVKASMADIHENTFLGSAAMPQPDRVSLLSRRARAPGCKQSSSANHLRSHHHHVLPGKDAPSR